MEDRSVRAERRTRGIEVGSVDRRVQAVIVGVLWLVCMAALIRVGGGGWVTRAVLLIGLLTGIMAYSAPR